MPASPDRSYRRTERLLGTFVTIEVVSHPDDGPDPVAAFDRAFEWVQAVERCCSRFDPESELRRLGAVAGTPVRVSRMLFDALQFAVVLAGDTGGAFDPTVGDEMAARGFNRHHLTGQLAHPDGGGDPAGLGQPPTYRDITFDPDTQSVTVSHPLTLDLGAVAKGLEIGRAHV